MRGTVHSAMATKARHLKTPIQLWVADQRKAGGYSSKDLADWTGVTIDTARGWESRGRPSADALDILERKFGAKAPRDLADAPSADQSEIVAAIDRQTAMLERVLEAISSRLPVPPDPLVQEALRAWAEAEQKLSSHPTGTSSPPRRPSRARQRAVQG
jgi:transposase